MSGGGSKKPSKSFSSHIQSFLLLAYDLIMILLKVKKKIFITMLAAEYFF